MDTPSEEAIDIASLLSDLLYDPRFCYAHSWKAGDFLIADNIEVSVSIMILLMGPNHADVPGRRRCTHALPSSPALVNSGAFM